MKAILEFDLPEEQEEFEMATTGGKWYAVAFELDQFLRGKVKHGDGDPKEMSVYEEVRNTLFEMMEDNGVKFE